MNLFPHQIDALERTKGFNNVAYYLDMGLGKTFVGSEKMYMYGNRVNLVVCQKSKVNDWVNHFLKHYSSEFLIFDLTNKTDFQIFLHNEEESPFERIGVINYELAWRRKELLNLKDFTLMLDESSLIQNESTKRSKFILKMHPENVILLSGTPTGGKYENLYSQLQLLGWDITKELYWKHYIDTEWVEEDGFFRKKVIGYKNVERLKSKLASHGAVFMKCGEAGINLPEKTIIPIEIPTTKEYKRFMKNRIVSVDGRELIGDTVLTARMYSRMLCGQYCEAKLEAFKDLAESTEDRLIVFYNFNEELVRMENIIKEMQKPISIVNGDIKDLNAYEQYENSVTFVQYQAGAMGLNLQKANKTIYFTLPQGSELFEQSHSRTNRIGQEKPCFYYYLICQNSVEEDILETLKIRKDYTDELFRKYEEREND